MSKKNQNQKVDKEVKEMDEEKIIDGTCKDVEDPEEEKKEDEETEPKKKGVMYWVTNKEGRRTLGSHLFAFAVGAGACLGTVVLIGKHLEAKDVVDIIDVEPVNKELTNLVSEAIGDEVSEATAEGILGALADTV